MTSLQERPLLPAPFVWPTPRQRRLQSIFLALFCVLALAPGVLLAVGAMRDPMLLAGLPAASVLAAAFGGAVMGIMVERRLGFMLVPLRGGPEAKVEIRPRSQKGVGLVVPFGQVLGHLAAFRTPFKVAAYLEAVAASPVGAVFFLVGGTMLPRELVTWTDALRASSGRAAPSANAVDLEEVAAAATRDPLAAPAGIEAHPIDAGAVFRYRGAVPLLRVWLAAFALAGLSPLVLPWLGLASWGVTALAVGSIESILLYGILLCGPLTVELEVSGTTLIGRRRRFGRTLWRWVRDARTVGLDITGLPASALRCEGRVRGITSPDVGGPDAAAVAWVAAAIRACARGDRVSAHRA